MQLLRASFSIAMASVFIPCMRCVVELVFLLLERDPLSAAIHIPPLLFIYNHPIRTQRHVDEEQASECATVIVAIRRRKSMELHENRTQFHQP